MLTEGVFRLIGAVMLADWEWAVCSLGLVDADWDVLEAD